MATTNLTTMTMKDQSPNCPLFKLPAELRNLVYELVFEVSSANTIRVTDAFSPSGHNATDTITSARKASAAPPSAALIRSCQHIYSESKGIFVAQKHTHKKYWMKEFAIGLLEIVQTPAFQALIDYTPMHMIDNLVVVADIQGKGTLKWGLYRDQWKEWQTTYMGIDASTRDKCNFGERGTNKSAESAKLLLKRVLRHSRQVPRPVHPSPVLCPAALRRRDELR